MLRVLSSLDREGHLSHVKTPEALSQNAAARAGPPGSELDGGGGEVGTCTRQKAPEDSNTQPGHNDSL